MIKAQGLQFIHSLAPAQDASSTATQQRLARSHAARSAHARARRLRTIQYQAQKAQDAQRQQRGEDAETPRYWLLHALSYHRRDPFASSARRLRPMEEMFFDHYVTVVIPLMRCNGLDVEFYRRMTLSWIPLALSEDGLLDVLFLSACRHLNECYQAQPQAAPFSQMAFQYKLQLLRSLREEISAETPHFTDASVIKAIMLAYDELWVRDEVTMKNHVEGAVKMVTLKGGPQTLGLDGFIERLLFNLLAKVNNEIGKTITSPFDPRLASVEIM
ncbi:hypothetical protein BDW68DRAFT_159974 [Aspergillus falconensis]